MLRFTYFGNNFYGKIVDYLVFGKHNRKIKVPSNFQYSLPLNFYKQCGDCLALRV